MGRKFKGMRFPLSEEREKSYHFNIFINGGLIAIGLIILQDFFASDKLDVPSFISILAFAVAIPLLSGDIVLLRIRLDEKHWVVSVWGEVMQYCFFLGIIS